MYRECLFEYNGINSNQYNLMLVYESSAFGSVSTGAEYEAVTDVLPKASDHLLYGLKYADKPLSFGIEILSLDNEIPIDKIDEVKEWLFGQDGYKRFVTIDERRNYYLNAILIPDEDIVDIQGLRGFRCTLQNASGFWYKDEEVSFNNLLAVHSINVKTVKDFFVFPNIEIKLKPFSKAMKNDVFHLTIVGSNGTIYLSDTMTDNNVTYNINTKFGTCGSSTGANISIIPPLNFSPPLKMINGVNVINFSAYWINEQDEKESIVPYIESLTYRYKTLHRLGGF